MHLAILFNIEATASVVVANRSAKAEAAGIQVSRFNPLDIRCPQRTGHRQPLAIRSVGEPLKVWCFEDIE